MKARRLPLLVDAHQWFPPGDPRRIGHPMIQEHPCALRGSIVGKIFQHVETGAYHLQGAIDFGKPLSPGDWIIRREREDGRVCIYAISDDAFRAGYAPMGEDDGPFAVMIEGPGLSGAVAFHESSQVLQAIGAMGKAMMREIDRLEREAAADIVADATEPSPS